MEKYSHKGNIRNIRTIRSGYEKLLAARNRYIDAAAEVKKKTMYSEEYQKKLLEEARSERDAVMKAEAQKIQAAAMALRYPAEYPALDGTDKELLNALQMIDVMGSALDPDSAAGIIEQFRTDQPALKAIGAKLNEAAEKEPNVLKKSLLKHQADAALSYAEPLNNNTLDNIIDVSSKVLYNPDNFAPRGDLKTFPGEWDIRRLKADAERIGLDIETDPDIQTWESNREQLRQSDPLAPKLKAAKDRLEVSWRNDIQRQFMDTDEEHAGEYAKYADEQFAKRPEEGYAIYEEVHNMWRENMGIKSASASPSDED